MIEAHPSVVEALIGLDGESVEELEHELRRGIYIRANFDFEYEDYEITSGFIEDFDKEFEVGRRAQVLEVNVRRSAFENSSKIVGWTDNGFYVELIHAGESVGTRARAVLHEVRRSFGVADLIVPGTSTVNRSMA